MAEGHAVARWADALQVLVGEHITSIQVPPRWRERAANMLEARVTRVHARGKHLVIEVTGDWLIHTHAMQYGSWQVGPIGEPLRKPDRFIRLRLMTARHDAIFYHGPVMEVLPSAEFAAHERYHGLGPDLLHDDFDVGAVRRRLRAQGPREIGDTVLDQRVVSGIGNIYKSEGLFLAAIDPFRRADSITDRELEVFFAELIPLMQAGRRIHGMTITLPEELQFEPWLRNWVYRRRGRPCFVCATPIAMRRQGEFERPTYFCPHCQNVTSGERSLRQPQRAYEGNEKAETSETAR
jgi:endonuclease-8